MGWAPDSDLCFSLLGYVVLYTNYISGMTIARVSGMGDWERKEVLLNNMEDDLFKISAFCMKGIS